MVQCSACGTDNKPGAIMCETCGEPLEVMVGASPSSGSPTGPSAAAGAVSPAPKKPRSLPSSKMVETCKLVDQGRVCPDREFEIPQDDCEMLLGRSDLDQGIIPDVDLTKFSEKVEVGGKLGYTFSRRQAVMSRRMGRVNLKALGGAKTMYQSNGQDWRALAQDEEVELSCGDRFRFGGSEGSVMFEAA